MVETLQIGLALTIGGIGLFLVAYLRNVRAAAVGSAQAAPQRGGAR